MSDGPNVVVTKNDVIASTIRGQHMYPRRTSGEPPPDTVDCASDAFFSTFDLHRLVEESGERRRPECRIYRWMFCTHRFNPLVLIGRTYCGSLVGPSLTPPGPKITMKILVLRGWHSALPVAVVTMRALAFGTLVRTQQANRLLPICCRMIIDQRDNDLRDTLINLALATEVCYPSPHRVAAIAETRLKPNTSAPITNKLQTWYGVARITRTHDGVSAAGK
ncbi:hypothetical protein [Mycobacteroides abscessus]|uniref:hypothetical protein n=1 Tax=Mycobacteroides abscessus TaxID=36809 RepID=UPI0013F685AA|nr:hypothetical protein [Mycobacteroides abscessus]